MTVERFRLALDQTGVGEWARFQQLATVFTSYQYPNLRPMGTASGDKGRDAELYSPDGAPQVLFQFSVQKEWQGKIKATLSILKKNFAQATVLIYVTNQSIGAKADNLRKQSLTEHGISLDILDREWLTTKYESHAYEGLEKNADEYARHFVDPFLGGRGVIPQRPIALTEQEAQAAIVYLEIQWENDTRDKGLTKICFEALVRSVLRETDDRNRLKRSEILERVRAILPSMILNASICMPTRR